LRFAGYDYADFGSLRLLPLYFRRHYR